MLHDILTVIAFIVIFITLTISIRKLIVEIKMKPDGELLITTDKETGELYTNLLLKSTDILYNRSRRTVLKIVRKDVSDYIKK